MKYDITPIVERLKLNIKDLVALYGEGRLDIVETSDDFASKKYIGNKIKLGRELGINVRVIKPEEIVSSEADGIIVQLPVGELYDENDLIMSIPRSKDVDGFLHLDDIMRYGCSDLEPCTALGVRMILAHKFGDITGLNVVIINRSNIVGKPLAMSLINMGCTVTVCHSKTDELTMLRHIKHADAVVTAVGKPNFITRDMLSGKSFVIDVGICRDENGKVCGDCDRALYDDPNVLVTPVPKGVGQLTVLNLLYNTMVARINACGEAV